MEVISVFDFLLLFLRSSMVLPHNVMVGPVAWIKVVVFCFCFFAVLIQNRGMSWR